MGLETERVERLRQVPITTIIGVRPTSRRVSIRCPFHNEKTPSMVLYPNGGYHCYGCGAHGNNSIDFLMGLGASFPEALEEIKKYE